MVSFSTSAYAAWRSVALESSYLRETVEGVPSEHLMQLVWQHQRVRPGCLVTAGGEVVEVLHPGFWNGMRGLIFGMR